MLKEGGGEVFSLQNTARVSQQKGSVEISPTIVVNGD